MSGTVAYFVILGGALGMSLTLFYGLKMIKLI